MHHLLLRPPARTGQAAAPGAQLVPRRRRRSLGGEADAWADRILDATAGPGQEPAEPAHRLWLYTTTGQAGRQQGAGQPDQAAQTYRRVLAYLQGQPETGWTRASIAVSYHRLGITAQKRGRLDEAEDWYRKSLTIDEELGNHPGMALTYAQLGLLAEGRAQAPLALAWIIRCVTLFDEFPSSLTGAAAGPSALVRLTRQLGLPALEAAWQQVTGQPLPQAIRDHVTSTANQPSPEQP